MTLEVTERRLELLRELDAIADELVIIEGRHGVSPEIEAVKIRVQRDRAVVLEQLASETVH